MPFPNLDGRIHQSLVFDFRALRSISKYRFGVEYLGIAENPPCLPVYGLIMGNERMLINLCCSAANRVNQSDPCSWTNVLFILNMCSPTTVLSKFGWRSDIEMFGWRSDIPIPLRVQSEKVQWVYPAPPRSQFTDLNILGMDFLEGNKVRTIIDSEYGTFMLDTSQPMKLDESSSKY
jgi:hypothetical protein